MEGYTGKIAWIDLTKGSVKVEELEEALARKYLGGKGLGAYLLYQNLSPNTHPYDPNNPLIFITGPLTGTTFPAVSRSAVITRSPMTGTFLDSYSGGFFGPQMKYAGYDAFIIMGKARKPVYIVADNEKISIKGAEHLWGLSTSETENLLKNELKGERISIAAIGQAGERLVRFSGILNEKRIYGRGGAGAVMGSKNLKAVVVKGNRKIRLADEMGFKEIVKRCQQKIGEHPMTKKGGVFPRIGTMMTVDLTQETGTFPTKNWQENTFDHAKEINGEAFERYLIRPRACFACPIGCSRDTKILRGGIEFVSEGPEYETIYAFGSNCEIEDPEVIIAAEKLCDEYGMDTISCGAVIGFAMECFGKGLIPEKEMKGINLSFGNGDALIEVIHLIAKREGMGGLLSEGVKIASEKIKGSSTFAIHVKGLELPGYDPRGMKGQGLTYALSDRGACHLRSNTLRTELLGIPQVIDRYAYEGKAEMVRELQLNYVTFDCLIACIFGAFAISLQDYTDALSSATGWPFTLKELRSIAERSWNLTRLFNVREGFTRKDDTLPERLFTQASTRGPSKGQVVDRDSFEKMLDEYYQVVGWERHTGVPTQEKLMELGIEKMAQHSNSKRV
jgi:aldehyde:ferredoxin oxidoreductase